MSTACLTLHVINKADMILMQCSQLHLPTLLSYSSFLLNTMLPNLSQNPFYRWQHTVAILRKGKGFPYLLPSIRPRADPGVQAVSPQVTISHPPSGRLPLLFARPAIIFKAAKHHCPCPVPSYTAW